MSTRVNPCGGVNVLCERCGRAQDTLEITAFGDKERRYVVTHPCDCPGPRCPFSHGRLDDQGRCTDSDCFMWVTIVPIPEIA